MKTALSVLWMSCCAMLLSCGIAPSDEPSSPTSGTVADKGPPPPTLGSQRTALVALSNGVPVTGISGVLGSQQFWTIVVPPGASSLTVNTHTGPGDADLYVRYGSAPTTSTYDCTSRSTTNIDSCTINNPQAGTWHVMLLGYRDFSGLTLVANYVVPVPTVFGMFNANIDTVRPACTAVLFRDIPPSCFNPIGTSPEPGITLSYQLPTLATPLTGVQRIPSNMSAFILYNTKANVLFGAATHERFGVAFPSGAASTCASRLSIASSPAPSSGWPQGTTTQVESGEPWGSTLAGEVPTFRGAALTSLGISRFQHPCRTTVEFRYR